MLNKIIKYLCVYILFDFFHLFYFFTTLGYYIFLYVTGVVIL